MSETQETPNSQHPLILVFYLDRELMNNPQIIGPYAEYVNDIIVQRQANAMAFFLPTDGDEKIECINPVQVEPAKMEKIMKMVDEISRNFLDIGQGADNGKNDEDNNIELEEG